MFEAAFHTNYRLSFLGWLAPKAVERLQDVTGVKYLKLSKTRHQTADFKALP